MMPHDIMGETLGYFSFGDGAPKVMFSQESQENVINNDVSAIKK